MANLIGSREVSLLLKARNFKRPMLTILVMLMMCYLIIGKIQFPPLKPISMFVLITPTAIAAWFYPVGTE